MLSFEKAIKRFEKSKKFKPKNLDYELEYLKILYRRQDFLQSTKDIDIYTTKSDIELAEMAKEEKIVTYLVTCLECQRYSHKCTKLRKYTQCLKDIKEIAENLKSPHCTECSQVLNNKGKCTGDCANDYKKQIQEKISECIGVEE